MSTNMQLKLASNRLGRIVLHLACMTHRRGFARHAQGIVRELKLHKGHL